MHIVLSKAEYVALKGNCVQDWYILGTFSSPLIKGVCCVVILQFRGFRGTVYFL